MSTHNIGFHGEIRKNIGTFRLRKKTLSGAMLYDGFCLFVSAGDSDLQSMLGGMSQQQLMQLLGR